MNMICQRIKRCRSFTLVPQGHVLSLLPVEPTIASAMIQFARIRESIIPSQFIISANIIIKYTPVQANLFALKPNFGPLDNLGVGGTGYCHGFVKRNKDKIVREKG